MNVSSSTSSTAIGGTASSAKRLVPTRWRNFNSFSSGSGGRKPASTLFFLSFAFLRIFARSTMHGFHSVLARGRCNSRRFDQQRVVAEGIEQRRGRQGVD